MSKMILGPDLKFEYDKIVFDTSCYREGAEVRFYNGKNHIATIQIDRFDKGDLITVDGLSGELDVSLRRE